MLRRFAWLLLGITPFALAPACGDQQVAQREPPNFVPDAGADGASAEGGGVPTKEGVVRVASFNVRKLFDTVCDTRQCGGTNFEEAPTQGEIDAKIEQIAAGIQIIQPDVIALAEIENLTVFGQLRDKLGALGMSFPIGALGETGGAGSIDVAVLAKGALTEVKTHRDVPLKRPDGSATTFARELLQVRMTFGSRTVVMFAAHYVAKVNDDPGRRLAEATATQQIMTGVAKELPDALVVLGGDLNDTPGSPPIAALEAGGALFRVASDRPLDKQATYTFNGVDQAIDHIFVVAGQKDRYVATSTTVYRDGKKGFASSDHGAIAADFSIK
ncbi:MAG: endonuclease/exonuclease/phosphatase family protein [Deltaproteobacteria bacterium]|nr:endonuclease/exonuclease/phosphatase family protein [Deltaproteobacteria bacterium]